MKTIGQVVLWFVMGCMFIGVIFAAAWITWAFLWLFMAMGERLAELTVIH